VNQEIQNEKRKKARLMGKAKQLSDADLLQVLGARAVVAKAKGAPKAKAKAKAKAKG